MDDLYYLDSMGRTTRFIPELAKGTNHTQWSNHVYQSTQLPPARQEKFLKAIGWIYKARGKGRGYSRKNSYAMYGLGYKKRFKKYRL